MECIQYVLEVVYAPKWLFSLCIHLFVAEMLKVPLWLAFCYLEQTSLRVMVKFFMHLHLVKQYHQLGSQWCWSHIQDFGIHSLSTKKHKVPYQQGCTVSRLGFGFEMSWDRFFDVLVSVLVTYYLGLNVGVEVIYWHFRNCLEVKVLFCVWRTSSFNKSLANCP